MHGYKVVEHVIWPPLNEVPMGLCACQAILFDHLMRLSDQLIPRHERMLSAWYLSHLRRLSSHFVRVYRIRDTKQIRCVNNKASKSLNFWFKTFGAQFILYGNADSRRRLLRFPSHRACWTVFILTYHNDSLLSSTNPFSSFRTRSFLPAWASNSYLGPT